MQEETSSTVVVNGTGYIALANRAAGQSIRYERAATRTTAREMSKEDLMPTRNALLRRSFVEAADTLTSDFDVLDFLSSLAMRCVDLFDVTEAGVVLNDRTGNLQLVPSSSEAMTRLELFELQHSEGPSIDCHRSGSIIARDDLSASRDQWPRFVPEALGHGMHAAWAVPMRLRSTTLGSLTLMRDRPGTLSFDHLDAAQALADVASIGLVQQRVAEDARNLTEHLQTALVSRVVIEQAKGVLAERAGLSMDAAFDRLRSYARSSNRRLSNLAKAVAERDMTLVDAIAQTRPGLQPQSPYRARGGSRRP